MYQINTNKVNVCILEVWFSAWFRNVIKPQEPELHVLSVCGFHSLLIVLLVSFANTAFALLSRISMDQRPLEPRRSPKKKKEKKKPPNITKALIPSRQHKNHLSLFHKVKSGPVSSPLTLDYLHMWDNTVDDGMSLHDSGQQILLVKSVRGSDMTDMTNAACCGVRPPGTTGRKQRHHTVVTALVVLKKTKHIYTTWGPQCVNIISCTESRYDDKSDFFIHGL